MHVMLKSRWLIRPSAQTAVSIACGALLGLSVLSLPGTAAAYEPTTTLAGLTEQAALGSRLHRRLADRMSFSLGLFEPLRLDFAALKPELAHSLHVRLQALDDGQGYAPETLARQTGQSRPARRQHALGWLTAGTVIELVPAGRQRHHFLEPRSGRGLFRPAGQTAVSAAAQAVREGMSTTRQLLAGAAVDGTGIAAPDWISDPLNEFGVAAFFAAYERAVLEKTPTARESALAEALLAAGAIVGVLEQVGDPAHVRNDLADVVAGNYQRFVGEHYGRAGVPAPGSLPTEALLPHRLRDLFTTPSGLGLADRTARRFFSAGSLPGTELGNIPALAGQPPLPSPPFTDAQGQPIAEIVTPPGWPRAASGYLSSPQLKHLAVWERRSSAELDPRTGEPQQNLRFTLDEACYADYAALLLPEIGRYAQVALDYLFRGELQLVLTTTGAEPQLSVQVAETALGSGTVTVLVEKPEGTRSTLRTLSTVPTRPGATLASLPLRAEDVKDVRRVVVLFRGRDRHNEPVVTSAQLLLPTAEDAAAASGDAPTDAAPSKSGGTDAAGATDDAKSDANGDDAASSKPDSTPPPSKEPAKDRELAPLHLKNF